MNTLTAFKHSMRLFLLTYVVLLTGCIEDTCERTVTYTAFEPIYLSVTDFREAFDVSGPAKLQNPGKIYFKDDYIFISEVNRGVHVIDNADPSNPVMLSFIEIPGNHDVAGKGNILYADSQMDLLVIDISDPVQPRLVDRMEDVFPPVYEFNGFWADPARGVVADWVKRTITEEVNCEDANDWPIPLPWFNRNVLVDMTNGVPVPGTETNSGVGGSMARFGIKDHYLLTVNETSLFVFDIEALDKPRKMGESYIGWEIETLFPYGEHLFIGSRTGMLIFNITNPLSPEFVSQFNHARTCDPVVVEGDYAYVTLRSGNPLCDGFINQLDVVDIRSLSHPTLVETYPMHNPHGLGIREGTLFICDGDEGLKVYDAKDVRAIDENQVAHFGDIHAFDVIPLHNLLLMIGEDGFYQYDYSDVTDIRLLSKILVESE